MGNHFFKGRRRTGAKGGPPGDLYINVHVKQHPLFQRQGNDVICEMPITFVHAALELNLKFLPWTERLNTLYLRVLRQEQFLD